MSTFPPATTWTPTTGRAESSSVGVSFLVDTAGNFIVDPTSNFIVDTGILSTQIPATVWAENDSE